MPEYLAPGVYIEEVSSGPAPIEGVSTSTVGAVGVTERGPVEGLPVLITSFNQFQRIFGGFLPESYGDSRWLAYAVQGFFENGGQRIYIKRVVKGAAAQSGSDLTGGMSTRLRKDARKGATTVELDSLFGIQNGTQITLSQTKKGQTTGPETLNVVRYNNGTNQVTLDNALQNSYEARYTSVTTNLPNNGTPVQMTAASPGSWGNGINVQISHGSLGKGVLNRLSESVPGSGQFDTLQLSSTANFYPGALLEINQGAVKQYGKVASVNGPNVVVRTPFASANDLDPNGTEPTVVQTREFSVVAATPDGMTEQYPALSLDNASPYYYQTVFNGDSQLVRVAPVDTTAPNDNSEQPFVLPTTATGLGIALSRGADDLAFTDEDFIGVDQGPGQRTGLQALEDIEEISIILVPGKTSLPIQNAMIDQCERLKYRFAILDPVAPDPDDLPFVSMQKVEEQRSNFDTRYAAIYYPQIRVRDSLTHKDVYMPPSGHMAGIYARVDVERGVHKAPANEVVRSITGLQFTLTKGEQDILNPPPYQINVIRDFRSRGRGFRVWGARAMTSDSEWKYIPVRRLFIFLEASIERGIQWAVFEPNSPELWARVRQSISMFLNTVWRNGALFGTSPEQAYFVKCDETTMTQDDLDNGRLIVLIGVAAVKPAEYVIIRIGQKTALPVDGE